MQVLLERNDAQARIESELKRCFDLENVVTQCLVHIPKIMSLGRQQSHITFMVRGRSVRVLTVEQLQLQATLGSSLQLGDILHEIVQSQVSPERAEPTMRRQAQGGEQRMGQQQERGPDVGHLRRLQSILQKKEVPVLSACVMTADRFIRSSQ